MVSCMATRQIATHWLVIAAITLSPWSSSILHGGGIETAEHAENAGDFSTAAKAWEAAAQAYTASGEVGHRIDAMIHIATSYQGLGQYRAAVTQLETALALADGMGDPSRAVAARNALGVALTLARQPDRGEALLVEAIALAEKQGPQASAEVRANLGNLYLSLGYFDKALREYRDASALGEVGRQEFHSTLSGNAAIAALAAERYDEAADWSARAIEYAKKLGANHSTAFRFLTAGRTRQFLGERDVNRRIAMYASASAAYEEAMSIGHRLSDARVETYALGYLGSVAAAEGRTNEALQFTRRAAFIAQESGATEALYRWQWQIGRLFRSSGDSQQALGAYRQAVTTLQSIRGDIASGEGNRASLGGFRETIGPLYFELADLLLKKPDETAAHENDKQRLIEARESIERFKSAELADYFRDECIARLQTKVTAIEGIAPGTAIIYLIPLTDRTEILVSTPAGLSRHTIPVTSDLLTAEVREFRKRLETGTNNRFARNAQKLYDWLIRPIEPILKTNKIHTLVFVPDGALRTIPMGALHDGDQFLIQKFAVAVTPGLNLMEPKPFDRTQIEVLSCGFNKPMPGFAALEYVDQELGHVQSLLGGRQLKNQDFNITEMSRQMAAKPPTIIHIASHAQFGTDAAHTFLLTMDVDKEPLSMNALEALIRPSQFRGRSVELLTLSACETAAGDDRAALGLAGVAIKAGARSALATLWCVNDEVSSTLVVKFYEQLKNNPSISKAQALQNAQVAVLSDGRYEHPRYWAPYMMIGNWQ